MRNEKSIFLQRSTVRERVYISFFHSPTARTRTYSVYTKDTSDANTLATTDILLVNLTHPSSGAAE